MRHWQIVGPFAPLDIQSPNIDFCGGLVPSVEKTRVRTPALKNRSSDYSEILNRMPFLCGDPLKARDYAHNTLPRHQRAPLSREATRRAQPLAELRLGVACAAGCGVGGKRCGSGDASDAVAKICSHSLRFMDMFHEGRKKRREAAFQAASRPPHADHEKVMLSVEPNRELEL